MSIDELGRDAAREARSRAANGVDSMTMLQQLKRTNRMRTTGSVVAVAAVAAAVVVVLITHDDPGKSATPPAGSLTNSLPTPTCDAGPSVRCVGLHKFRVALPVPLVVTVPANFEEGLRVIGRDAVESYRNDTRAPAGVDVMENAIPVKYDATWTRDPSAGTTAESMAHWLENRPFLIHAKLAQITVDGMRALRVTADLKPGVATPAEHGDAPAAPTFADNTAQAGYRTDLVGEYVLVDVPGAGVTVIWSWAFGHSDHPLLASRSYLDALSFG